MRCPALLLLTLAGSVLAAGATSPESAATPAKRMYLVAFSAPSLAEVESVADRSRGKADRRGKLDVTSASSKAHLAKLDLDRKTVLAAAKARLGRTLLPRFIYRFVANGMALELDAEEARLLAQVPGVAGVQPDFKRRLLTDAGPQFIGSGPVWNGQLAGISATKGEGVVVGIIDSGINVTHPSFADVGGDFYNHANPRGRFYGLCTSTPSRCNDKLIGLYDFTSEGQRNGSDTTGHGSHVASTAVGNFVNNVPIVGRSITLNTAISGVAPHANLISYKACTVADDCPGSSLLQAIDQAAADRVDVINYSIGGDPTADPWSGLRSTSVTDEEAFLNARSVGVVPVAAAGNEGPGAETVVSPGNAPWIITVANATHGGRLANALVNVSGFGISTPQRFDGDGLTAGLSNRRIVHAKDFGNALCGTGPTQNPPNGASNPFAPGTFNGEIVICVRGIYGRVEKGLNLQLAGAGGMILVNSPAESESVVGDSHYLPAVHLGYLAGRRLSELVETARIADWQITGEIIDSVRSFDGRGDALSVSSSRGPAQPHGGFLKPNITAPGSSIIAAAISGNGTAVMTGTSMASPHVTGAVALIAAAHPDWTVAQIESALLTTGLNDVLLPDALTPASANEAGIGRARVDAAVQAGLHFEPGNNNFRTADPTLGGDPKSLNMPYLVDPRCFQSCSFTRSVSANGIGGNYSVAIASTGNALVSVNPSSFSLAPGATQSLNIAFDVSDGSLPGSWAYGEVLLVNTDTAERYTQRLPFAVYAYPGPVPETLQLTANENNGFVDASFADMAALRDASFTSSALAKLEPDARILPRDGDLDSPYDAGGTFFKTYTLAGSIVGATRYTVYAETFSATATDIDLYMGRDLDGDGGPDEAEELCSSTSPDTEEDCSIDLELAGDAEVARIWIMVHNYAGSANGNAVTLTSAAVPGAELNGLPLAATGPRRVALQEPFKVRIAWNEAQMLAGERWLGFVGIGPTRDNPEGIARIPVVLNRNSSSLAPIVLDSLGDGETLALPAGTAHERIVFDVPSNASSVTVSSSGSGEVDLYLAKATAAVAPPEFASAPPRGLAQGTSIHPGATEEIVLNAPTLTPGRWYLTPVNTGGSSALINLGLRVFTSGSDQPPADNAYFNAARSGHGIFLNQGGDQWFLVWYTYLQDGTPAWYIAQSLQPSVGAGAWSAPLFRVSWDGTSGAATRVGEVLLTFSSSDTLTFSWMLDGTYGSEPMQALLPRNCGVLNTSGHWYAPAQPGYGLNIMSINSAEVTALYLYDVMGNPRWLFSTVESPAASQFGMVQSTGFCPLCAAVTIATREVGALTRTLSTANSGTLTTNLGLLTPLGGRFDVSQPIVKISRNVPCSSP